MVFDTKLKNKCQYAIWRLSNRLGFKSSRLYEANRIAIKGLISESTTKYFSDPLNREKASQLTKELMKDPIYYNSVVESLRKTHESIDHTTKEWTERSFNSKESLRKSKDYSQTEENRKKCSERELSKGKETLSKQGREGHLGLRNKFATEEDYKAYLASINQGRKRIVNVKTGEIKQTRDANLQEDWKFWSSLTKEDKQLFV